MSQHFGPASSRKATQTHGPIAIDAELVRRAQGMVGKLKARGQSLVTAESCAGGFIASTLFQTEGAGDVLHGSFVTHAKEETAHELGVSMRLLAQNTSAVAEAMAKGALARSTATIALTVSGDMAPGPHRDRNPLGLVFFCCRNRFGQSVCIGKDFGDHTHQDLMRVTVVTGLTMLEDFVRKAG